MNEHRELFSAFDLIEPSEARSKEAVQATHQALAAAAADLQSGQHTIQTVVENEPVPARNWWFALATAASVLVAAAILSLLLFPQSNAIAWETALEKIVRQPALHFVSEVRQSDGSWKKLKELKCSEVAVRQSWFENDSIAREEIDDGSHHWLYRQECTAVVKGPSMSVANQISGFLDPLSRMSDLELQLDSEDEIDGVRCRNFETEIRPGARVCISIDDQDRMRRLVGHSQDEHGDWIPTARYNVVYDVEHGSAVFRPDFAEDIAILDADQLFGQSSSLETAIHSVNQSGYIIAVHQLVRVSDFDYFMLLSFRPDDISRETLQLAKGEKAGFLASSFRNQSNGQSVSTETCRMISMTSFNGIEVFGYVGSLSGFEKKRLEFAGPKFTLHANSKLWKHYEAITSFELKVPLPEETKSLRETLESHYNTIASLEMLPLDDVYLHDEKNETEHVDEDVDGLARTVTKRKHHARTSEITFDKFYQHIHSMLPESTTTTTVGE